MAAQAREAFDAGASHHARAHPHPSKKAWATCPRWDPDVAQEVVDAIRQACPGVIINLTTGVVGKDISGPLACIRRVTPEIAACNAGSLNYLKIKEDGSWAWPPMVFDNPVAKVQQFLDVMQECRHAPRVRVLRRGHRALGHACTSRTACSNPRWAGPNTTW